MCAYLCTCLHLCMYVHESFQCVYFCLFVCVCVWAFMCIFCAQRLNRWMWDIGPSLSRSLCVCVRVCVSVRVWRRFRLHLSANQQAWKSNLPGETAGCTSSAMDGHYQRFISDRPQTHTHTHTHTCTIFFNDHMHEWAHTSTHSPLWQRLIGIITIVAVKGGGGRNWNSEDLGLLLPNADADSCDCPSWQLPVTPRSAWRSEPCDPPGCRREHPASDNSVICIAPRFGHTWRYSYRRWTLLLRNFRTSKTYKAPRSDIKSTADQDELLCNQPITETQFKQGSFVLYMSWVLAVVWQCAWSSCVKCYGSLCLWAIFFSFIS